MQAPRVAKGDAGSHEPMVVGLLAWGQGPLAGQGLGHLVCGYACMIASLCIAWQTTSTMNPLEYVQAPRVTQGDPG